MFAESQAREGALNERLARCSCENLKHVVQKDLLETREKLALERQLLDTRKKALLRTPISHVHNASSLSPRRFASKVARARSRMLTYARATRSAHIRDAHGCDERG